MSTHYETLGIARGASSATIKDAYRKLAKIHHPDVNPGDKAAEARFKLIGEAYALLSDPSQKAKYDTLLADEEERRLHETAYRRALETRRAQAATQFEALRREAERRAEFRTSAERTRERPEPGGSNAEGTVRTPGIDISLLDAFNGKAVDIDFSATVTCPECGGAERIPVSVGACRSCGGTGQQWNTSGSSFDFAKRGCRDCGGTAFKTVFLPCPACKGKGNTTIKINGTVTIPRGVPSRFTLTLQTKEGVPVAVPVIVTANKRFDRDGNNLLVSRKIAPKRAIRGTTLTIVGIDGTKLRVTVPKGTHSGTILRVAGHGMTRRDAPDRGDLMITIEV